MESLSVFDMLKIGWRDGVQAMFCIIAYSPIGERFRLKRWSAALGRVLRQGR